MLRAPQFLARLTALGALLLAAAALAAPDNSGVRVYKWTDSQGIVHYGDSVPPQYAQDEREVLNGDGVEIGRIAGSKTAAQENRDEQAAKVAQQRAQHDKFLLTTYASTHEIEQLRDERLQQIDGQIQASSSYIDSLTLRLAALQERAMHFAPYSGAPGAQRMPDELAQDLVHTLNEARTQRAALDGMRQEQATTLAQFATDIERYRELKPNS
jgi:hypothetical protein